MNNGLSSFNSALFHQSVQRRLMRSGLTRTHLPSAKLPAKLPAKLSVKPSVNFAAARWLAATLSVTGLMGGGWLLEAHPVQAQIQAPAQAAQAPAQPPAQPPAQVENPAQGGDGLPTLASPEVPAPNSAVPSAPPAIAPPTQANTPRPNSQLEAGGFFEPSINPTLDPRIPPVLSVPGTQVNPASLSESFNGYHLGPGDSIFVSVQRYPDLSFQATLDLQGTVVLPIEGAVSLKGLTLAEATNKIRGLYDRYVTFDAGSNRDVSLTLVAQRSVEVTILGAVQRPGFYPLSDPSVATALLTAGGATRTSDLRTIQIQRRIPQGNGFVESRVDVDLFTPLKEGSALPDVRLEDGDVMVIPEIEPSQISSYDRNLVARSTLAQPIINVRFLNYAGGRGGVGTLNLNNGSTFLDAVSLLGVNADTANLGDVALIRYDAETGRAVTISVDAKQAIQGDITQNPPLEDTDVIVVGRNLVGRLSFALQTITRPFRDVAGFSNFFNDFLNNNSFP